MSLGRKSNIIVDFPNPYGVITVHKYSKDIHET